MGISQGTIKKLLFFLLSIAVFAVGYFAPSPNGLSESAKMTLVILAFLFVMWTGKVMPNWASAVMGMMLLPFVGAAESMNEVFGNFINSTFFFLLGVFAVAAAVHKSDLPSRLMVFFIRKFGRDSKKLLFAFAATTWILSAFMSDLASCAIVAGLAIVLLKDIEFPRSFSKSLMIVIPLSSMCGGITMPISSATNATIMQKLAIITGGDTVGFLSWTVVGLPVALFGLLIVWGSVVLAFKPEPLTDDVMAQLQSHFSKSEKMSRLDKQVIALVCFMMVLWIAGTWVSFLSTAFVALAGMVIMFLPGIEMLTFNEFRDEVPWDLMVFIGALFSLCQAMVDTGAITWIMETTLGNTEGWTPTMFVIAASVVLILIRSALPGGPILVGLVTPAVLAMGVAFGLEQMTILMILSIWGQLNCLVPILDGQWLMTYNFHYFNTVDVMKIGIPIAAAITLFTAFIVPILAGFGSSIFG